MLDAQIKHPLQHLYKVEISQDMLPNPGEGMITISQLRASWHQVIARHSILRTIFIPSATPAKQPQPGRLEVLQA